MIVDGQNIASEILSDVKKKAEAFPETLKLGILVCAPTFATKKFISVKKRRALEANIEVRDYSIPETASTEEATEVLKTAVAECDGIVLQLPFPKTIDTNALLQALPATHDVDAIGESAHKDILPPVVGAIREISERHAISFEGKHAVVLGKGRLVGAPAAVWLEDKGAIVESFLKDDGELRDRLRIADIVVLGIGVPNFVTPEMLKEGVVIFDAGTSEDAGKLAGDADPRCAEVASLFTPVPGGIGPITVALLFSNLVTLCALRQRSQI